MPSGLKNKTVILFATTTTKVRNRPHQKTITYSHTAPPPPHRKTQSFWVFPLTDGSDVAMLALATWRRAITIFTPPICPPVPTVMKNGQLLDDDTTGHRWSVQQWLEVYTHALQHVGEAAEGKCWRPEGEGFSPKVSLLVEAFICVTGARDAKNCAMCCSSEPPGDVPCQRNKGAYMNIISYLDELATCWPSRKAWDKLVWLPVSSVPCMPQQAEHLNYI